MSNDREQTIIRTSVIGIAANVALAGFKAVVGLLSASIAIVLDAVNNLSDAFSSLITIIGTKLAGKAPDKKHPLGYGRVEYLSAAVISVIVLYAGITSFVESVKKIIEPETPDYSPVALIIIGAAVAVKIFLGLYVKKTGECVNSDSLVASGTDAMFDSIISASTLAAAVIFILTGLSLESWLGALISAVIIKSGFEMLRDTISEILGERIDAETARAVRETICSFPEVRGAYDLIIHSYGPERLIASVHIELPDTMTIREADTLERDISAKVYQEHSIIMTGISVYSVNTTNDEAAKIEQSIHDIAAKYPSVLQIHGFYLEDKTIRFDIIIDFDEKDRDGVYSSVHREIQELYPDYKIVMALDYDITD